MRYMPVQHLVGDEILAATLTNAKMQTLIKEGTVLTSKIIDRIKRYGVQSLYIKDSYMENEVEEEISDTISPNLRVNSTHKIKQSFDRFHSKVFIQKNSLKYGDTGQNLIDGLQNISNDLINEILLSKNTRVMMNDIKTSNDYTYQHSINVAVLSLIIGTTLGLSSQNLQDLTLGAMLCDIGVQWVDEKILNKTEALTEQEIKSIKDHAQIGYQYLNDNTTFNGHVKSIVLQHHERIDGSGYPNGLKDDDIHPLAKIVMIADVYDAMTSDRPHRVAHNQHDAIEYIMAQAHKQYDFNTANFFSRKIVPYPVGTYVLLSNQQKGVILKNNPGHPLRPVLRTFGKSCITNTNDVRLDLLEHHNVVIEKIVYKL